MKIGILRVGMRVQHPVHGAGVVRAVSETSVDVDFESGGRRTLAADQELHPAEPLMNASGLDVPLGDFVRTAVAVTLRELGIEKREETVEGLANRWRGGTLVLKPADDSLQPKDLPMETFFHKIVMMRNNLRVLEQKVNASDKLEEAEKIELQQYITRCYGSMTTFNVLFKEKGEQF